MPWKQEAPALPEGHGRVRVRALTCGSDYLAGHVVSRSAAPATVAVSVALFGIMFVVPQYLQSVAGDDPVSAGLRLLPMMGGLLVAGGAASLAARAADTRLTVAAELVLRLRRPGDVSAMYALAFWLERGRGRA